MIKIYLLEKFNGKEQVVFGDIESAIFEAFDVSKEDADGIGNEIRTISSPEDDLKWAKVDSYEDITLEHWLKGVGDGFDLKRRPIFNSLEEEMNWIIKN